ncbi:hypothetical protein NEIPOLOT_01412 [Neisseria polysaccharea ATCC 43768]|nr:hypothetical protein NEIPOLOT_01412 [Neisseria polysaccharea ATCC 43768]
MNSLFKAKCRLKPDFRVSDGIFYLNASKLLKYIIISKNRLNIVCKSTPPPRFLYYVNRNNCFVM